MSNDEHEESQDEEISDDSSNKNQPDHIMLSYQWNNQELVEKIYQYLTENQPISVWMDKHGGMQENVFLR